MCVCCCAPLCGLFECFGVDLVRDGFNVNNTANLLKGYMLASKAKICVDLTLTAGLYDEIVREV